MNENWKNVKAEIDGLPITEKTFYLKKLAEDLEKELRELKDIYEKSDHVEHWAILQFIKQIFGENKE